MDVEVDVVEGVKDGVDLDLDKALRMVGVVVEVDVKEGVEVVVEFVGIGSSAVEILAMDGSREA